jgi:mono/diheme cytochrome c family protein
MTGAILCVLLANSALGARAQLDDTLRFPGGPIKAQIVANCQACHSVGLIAQQRLSLVAWTNELIKMEKWGATLSPDQNAAVAAYLFKNFNPDVPDAPGRLVRAPR